MVWKFIHFGRISFERASGWCQVAPGEPLRVPGGLANRLFCWLDISRVKLKSNWTVGESLLAFGQEAIRERRLNLFKQQWTFLQCLIWKIIYLENIFSNGTLSLMMSSCTRGTAQSSRWPCKPIILLIGHFEGQTEVQLNSWWKSASFWSRSNQRAEAKFI